MKCYVFYINNENMDIVRKHTKEDHKILTDDDKSRFVSNIYVHLPLQWKLTSLFYIESNQCKQPQW